MFPYEPVVIARDTTHQGYRYTLKFIHQRRLVAHV
jgi:hypothetical protein